MRRTVLALAAVGVLGLAAGACSGSGGTTTSSGQSAGASSPSTATTATTAPATSNGSAPPVQLPGTVNAHGTTNASGGHVSIEMDDFYFTPTYVKAPAGSTLTVDLNNAGSASHTFTINDQSINVVLPAGASKTVDVTVPSSGSVRFYCSYHVGQGMQGAIYTG